ncbi:hypothetical protein FHS83_003372 [Rhizomicrobium palustre]|uniref:ThuA-like domain-containing protein n=1 Tax=Rhizomicrobium palustre TaxID=189966 RepID=A0A846N244_9PROT|nr:ThuA domain-containing protein [Rhizomicrobium palustre]NIK90054.1 hypothetical protein [Rhizomicrobium palustre]
MRRIALLLAVVMTLVSHAFAADTQYKVLVLAMPSKYHYEFVPVARESLEWMAKLHAFDFTYATTADALDKGLSPYAAIMLLNTPTEELNAAERAHLESYMQSGGNAVVVHRAAMALPAGSWPWYEKFVGRSVGTHPMLQTGVVNVVDKSFPASFGLPAHWIWSDEFYPLSNPYNIAITPVLNVDETSYDPAKIWPGQKTQGMGKDHPEAWYHSFEKGRVFVTALGHTAEMYRDPHYLDHLMGGLYWAATGKGVQK